MCHKARLIENKVRQCHRPLAGVDQLARATELCLRYNNEALLRCCVQEITNFLSRVGAIYSYRWGFELIDILFKVMDNSKTSLMIDNDIQQLVLRKLDETRDFYLKEKNLELHRWACFCLIAWYKKLQQSIVNLNSEIGLSFELEAEHQQGRAEKTEGVKAGFFTDGTPTLS